jgi:hypothetical protein
VFSGNLAFIIALKSYHFVADIDNSVLVAFALITTSYLDDVTLFDERFFEEVLTMLHH